MKGYISKMNIQKDVATNGSWKDSSEWHFEFTIKGTCAYQEYWELQDRLEKGKIVNFKIPNGIPIIYIKEEETE